MDACDYLAKRYLGRALESSDGIPEGDIRRAEQRLGISLPASIRKYYARCGRNHRFNASHNIVRSLDDITLEHSYLVLMDENQSVVSWGIRLEDLGLSDPVVWQRNNSPPIEWYSEEKTWAELLETMFDWYAASAIWEEPNNPLQATRETRAPEQ